MLDVDEFAPTVEKFNRTGGWVGIDVLLSVQGWALQAGFQYHMFAI